MTRLFLSSTTLLLTSLVPALAQHDRGEERRRIEPPGRHVERVERLGRAPEGVARHQERQEREERRLERPSREPERIERREERREDRRERVEPRTERFQTRPEPALREREQPRRSIEREASPQRTREEARAWQERGDWRRGAWAGHRTWQEHRAHHWEAEHRTWRDRGGYGGYRIPDAQFRATFGTQNVFRIGQRPVIYQGYPRFSCGGYWFWIVDPWPEYWAEDWYDSDEFWIGWDGGYYLYSRHHPGVSLAISVSI